MDALCDPDGSGQFTEDLKPAKAEFIDKMGGVKHKGGKLINEQRQVLLFINDLPLNIDSDLTDLYADDTTLYYIDKSQACIEQQLQTALHKLSEWCKENEMLINTAKTKVMLNITT